MSQFKEFCKKFYLKNLIEKKNNCFSNIFLLDIIAEKKNFGKFHIFDKLISCAEQYKKIEKIELIKISSCDTISVLVLLIVCVL